MSRTLIGSVVESIRQQLMSTHRTELVVLDQDITDADTEFRVGPATIPALRAGSVISIDAERMRVVQVQPGPRLVTVVRGWSTHLPPTAHTDKSEVWINPRFDVPAILDAMYDEISSWDADLFLVRDAIVPIAHADGVVALPGEFNNALGVINVRSNWNSDHQATWPEIGFRVLRGSTFPGVNASNMLVRLLEPVHGGQLHISVGLAFDVSTFELDTDLVTDIGLRPSMIDVVKLGVRYRLVGDVEAARSARDAQDDPRRAEETLPAAASSEAMRLYALYTRRKAAEIMRFRSDYPLRRS